MLLLFVIPCVYNNDKENIQQLKDSIANAEKRILLDSLKKEDITKSLQQKIDNRQKTQQKSKEDQPENEKKNLHVDQNGALHIGQPNN